jgi:hypothetical protein
VLNASQNVQDPYVNKTKEVETIMKTQDNFGIAFLQKIEIDEISVI